MNVASHACVVALLLCGTTGCGYTAGSGLAEQGVRTVFVEVVGNETWRQRLEAELALAVSRELAASTELVPADRRHADAVLQVSLTNEQERTLVPGPRSSPVREGAFEVTIRVRLRRCRDDRLLVDRPVADRTEFRDPIGEDLTSARQELVADLARKIALALEVGF